MFGSPCRESSPTSFHFWRSGRILDHLAAPAEALLDAVGLSGPWRRAGERACLWAQAGAGNRDNPSARSRNCCCSTNRWPGLARRRIGRISALIRKISAERTILMVEHNLSVVADLSDTITVLTRGRILTEGDYATVVSKKPRGRRSLSRNRSCLSRYHRGLSLLRVEKLHAWYGESHILHGMSFAVGEGEVVTLLGRNGAGKNDDPAGGSWGSCRSGGARSSFAEPRSQGSRRTGSPGSASPIARRSAVSLRASTSRRTCCCRRRCSQAG